MMKKVLLLLILGLISVSVFSQKRDIIKIGGFGYNNWNSKENFIGAEYGAARLNYTFGYERLIGERLSISLTYSKILSLSETPIYDDYSGYTPASMQNYRFREGTYSANGYFIGYESKYHFDEFDEDGANSFYLGFNYQLGRITEELKDVRYEGTSSFNTKAVTFDPYTFSMHRLGVKLGLTYTGMFTSDFSIGVFLNSQPEANKQWLTPAPVNGVSFNASWVVGIPF